MISVSTKVQIVFYIEKQPENLSVNLTHISTFQTNILMTNWFV